MDSTIVLFLAQDGVTNGAIYALLALSLVLVFTITRVIFIPQGEFVAYGALTLAAFERGVFPMTAWFTVALGLAAFAADVIRDPAARRPRRLAKALAGDIGAPAALLLATWVAVPLKLGPLAEVPLTLAMLALLGPFLYRLVFQPLAEASVLVLLIAAVGVHLAMVGLGLLVFGAEGFRTAPLTAAMFEVGPALVSGQSLWVLGVTGGLIAALWAFFEHTLTGKALRATAVNRLGARLVGIPTTAAGRIAFALAALIGALSGVLIAPVTTVFYDTGFLTGLKGFVAAIIGGLVSYPLGAAAAILVGLVEAFASFWASTFKEVIVFTIIIPVLLWRSLRSTHVEDEE
ncbi:branched-chain amino acid ABC transporter permease [Azospirillum sp. TSO22-1]|uniref:branched-chain amino acid ABC transporter permease n=1 Tax=Azospirillum sp. TSO22-1 TaxID=716789 RepID=UPI000D615434|nr:branched-chain amino acid ABC transporter permease [Azospirillum sp. TSO22-1]PWC35178.1 ABC transporter permease [Azospirillum sp. TSO22-1]